MAAAGSARKIICCLLITVTWFSATLAKSDHCERYRLHNNHWIHRSSAISQSVFIPCDFRTDITYDWKYCRDKSSEDYNATVKGPVANYPKDKVQLDPKGLLITDVQPTDAGWYICRNKKSRRKRIFRLSVPWEERDVDLGASIVLRCRSAFYDSVIWYYGELDSDKNYILYWDSIFTKDSGRFKVLRPNSLRGIFDLSISNVQLSDAGIYRCHEYAVQHPGEVVYRLTVTDRTNNTTTDPMSDSQEVRFRTTTRTQISQPPIDDGGNDRNFRVNMILFCAFLTLPIRYGEALY